MKLRNTLSIASISALLLALSLPGMAYTAEPYISIGASTSVGAATNTGLGTSGTAALGYTVYAADGVTVITPRTTAGIVETSTGVYFVASGLTVPNGSIYIIKWDRTDTSTALGAAPTVATSLGSDELTAVAAVGTTATGIKGKTDLIATNSADSPNAVTGQTNAGAAATQTTPTAQQNADAAALTAQGYTTARAAKIDNADVATSTRQQSGVAVTLPANAPGTFLVNDTTIQGLGTGISGLNAKFGSPVLADFSHDLAAIQSATNNNGTAIAALPSSSAIANLLIAVGLSPANAAKVLAFAAALNGSTGAVPLPATPPSGYGGGTSNRSGVH